MYFILFVVVGVGVCFFFFLLIYRFCFVLLFKFLGFKWIVVIWLWIMYYEFKGQWIVIIDELYVKYGFVVWVVLDEVFFNDVEVFKDIYGIKFGFGKSDFYDMFVYYDERNIFISFLKVEVCIGEEFEWLNQEILYVNNFVVQ